MTGWIIFGCIVGIFIILLMSSVKVSFSLAEKVSFKIKYLFITLFRFDSDKEKDRAAKASTAETSKKSSKEKAGSLKSMLKRYWEGKKKTDLIFEAIEYIKKLLVKLKKLISRMRFKNFELYLSIGTDEAAKTALMYGNACSVIYPLGTLLSSAPNFDAKKITVKTDFSSDQLIFRLQGIVKVKVVYIILFVLSILFTIIKSKIGEIINGRA